MDKLPTGQKHGRVSGRWLLAETLGRAFDTGLREGLLMSKVLGQTLARVLLEGQSVNIPFVGTLFYEKAKTVMLYSHVEKKKMPQVIYPKVKFRMHKGMRRQLKEMAIARGEGKPR